MRALALISILVLVAAFADARPKSKHSKDGKTVTEEHTNLVEGKDEEPKNAKLARPAPEKPVVRKEEKPNGMPRPTFPMAPPAAAPGMLDPRTRMAMMMQAAQMQNLMQQQQGQGQMDPRQMMMMGQGMGPNPQEGGNPFAGRMPRGQGQNMTPLSPQQQQQQQQQMMRMAMIQQQQMMQQQQMQQQQMQQQQAMMAAQQGGLQETQPAAEQGPMDPREEMVMQMQREQQQQLDQIKEMQRQQHEAEDGQSRGDETNGDSMPVTPARQGLKAFRERILAMRAQGREMPSQMSPMAQNPMEQQRQMMMQGRPPMVPPGQMGRPPMMPQRSPMMPPQMMGQNNMMPPQMMGQNTMMPQQMMGQNPMMPPQMMGKNTMMPPQVMSRPPMMPQRNTMMPPQMMGQNPMMPPQMMGQRSMVPPQMMGQNPMMPPQMMGQNPMMPPQMMSRPPVMPQRNPMMGHSPMVPPQMMGRPPMLSPQAPMTVPRPMMDQPPMVMMPPTQMMARNPIMSQGPRNPVGPTDIESLRSVLAPGKGPIAVPLHSLQHVMGLENKLTDIRDELIRSFYMDLMQYKAMSQQFKSQMSAKLNLIHQIDAKLGTPIRSALANLSTKHHLNLPLSSPNGPQSTIIRRLKESIDDSQNRVYTSLE